ncbi:MAG: hypothetical protein AAGI23_22535 [Bacteroidota bacterium]
MSRQMSIGWRVLEGLFVVLEQFRVPLLYEWIAKQFKTHRPLDQRERWLAKFVYGDSIDLDKVRIDEGAKFGPKQYNLCYVSFNIINSWGKMSDELLIHELIHIWQYQHFGAAYIPRALWAQRTQEGYDYGGLEALLSAKASGKHFWDFNYEQQGDIIQDYFRLSQGKNACWGNGAPDDLAIYEYFAEEMRNFS